LVENLYTKMNKFQLQIEYKHKWHNQPLRIKTMVNDRIVDYDIGGSKIHSIDKKIRVNETDNTFRMIIDGKDGKSNIIDPVSNEMISETHIMITKFTLDGIDILPEVIATQKFPHIIGDNGDYDMDFKVPVYDWILETLTT